MHFMEFNNSIKSFHGKGIWIFEKDILLFHILGSSNYGYRSQYRDCEMNFMFSTLSNQLKTKLCQDISFVNKNSTFSNLANLKKQNYSIPNIIRVLSKFTKTFL